MINTSICQLTFSEFLPKKYYNHWSLFLHSMTLLSQHKINRDSLNLIKKSLETFVQQTEQLYGPTYMRMNIHQLLHLHKDVISWGLLWTHNTFSFESMNGTLTRLMHGTQSVPKAAVSALASLQRLSKEELKTSTNSNAKKLFSKLKGESDR